MTTIKITGQVEGMRYLEITQILGAHVPRVEAGKEFAYLVDYRLRSEADLAVVNLNNLHGVRAAIVGECS